MNPQYLEVGRIVSPHGINGEVKVIPLTNDPNRFKRLKELLIRDKDTIISVNISNVRLHKGFVILKLENVQSIEDAERLRDVFLLIDRKYAVKLPKGSYLICDIEGSDVYTKEGDYLGKVEKVIQTGANDIYQVKGDTEILVPALKSVVIDVDIENKKITVSLPEGLI